MKQEYKGKATDGANVSILPSFVLDPYLKNLRSYSIDQTLVTVLGEKFGVAQKNTQSKTNPARQLFFCKKDMCAEPKPGKWAHVAKMVIVFYCWCRWCLHLILLCLAV